MVFLIYLVPERERNNIHKERLGYEAQQGI